MEKNRSITKDNKRREIKSVDIPWWIGGPKVIAVPVREKRDIRAAW